MQDNIFYLIDKNIIKKNLISNIDRSPLNVNSVIDGRLDFYGLGKNLLSLAEKFNINYVLVDNINEAINIRKINNNIGIIVKYIEKDYIYDAIVNDIVITIYNNKDIDNLKEIKIKDDLKVLVYVDSGNHIEGIRDLKKTIQQLEDVKHIIFIGAYSTIYSTEKKYNELVTKFKDITFCMKKDMMRFLISDKNNDLNVNFFGKDIYRSDNYLDVSLIGVIKNIKRVKKGEEFCHIKMKKERIFGIINIPFKMNVKKVYIKDKMYKVFMQTDDYLIIEIDNNVKYKAKAEIFGSKSKNRLNDAILINNIPKYYLENQEIIKDINY